MTEPHNKNTVLQIVTEDAARREEEMQLRTKLRRKIADTRTVNQWIEEAKSQPVPRMLFSELWYEKEMCFLFADTNLGKSLLAVQIAQSISSGQPVPGFTLEAAAQRVLYFDFEISEKQFEKRYSIDWEHHLKFSDNFFRTQINTRELAASGAMLEDIMTDLIEEEVEHYDARVIIIDNLTYLCSDSEKTQPASQLMKVLNNLTEKLGLSVLVLTHTPKRNPTEPIIMKDIKGSGSLAQLCDAAFAIGQSSRDADLRYIKQIKQRSCPQTYGEDNVIICRLEKPENFLQLRFMEYGDELMHLRRKTEEEIKSQNQLVLEMHKNGLSLRQIGERLGMSHVAVSKAINRINNPKAM